jgi:hypothetical protein
MLKPVAPRLLQHGMGLIAEESDEADQNTVLSSIIRDLFGGALTMLSARKH